MAADGRGVVSAHQLILDDAPHEPVPHGRFPTSYGLNLSGDLPSINVARTSTAIWRSFQLFLAGGDAA
jgi:hypothetical protein